MKNVPRTIAAQIFNGRRHLYGFTRLNSPRPTRRPPPRGHEDRPIDDVHRPDRLPGTMRTAMAPRPRRSTVPVLLVIALAVLAAPSMASAQGDQLTWGVHISLAPTWFDPASRRASSRRT